MSLNKILTISMSALFMYSCSQSFNNNPLIDNANISVSTFSKTRMNKPEVIEIPSPNKNARPDGAKINTIVLHHTASKASAKATGGFFSDPAAKVSAHYTVDRTGYIVQSVPDSEASWHAGKSEFHGVQNVNGFSIGIEISNVGDNSEPYPDAQYDAIIKLVSYLTDEYNIPTANITRHRDVATPAGRKIDTSNNFSTSRVIDGVKASLRGEYKPETNPIKDYSIPQTLSVSTDKTMTFEDLADIYLDNEFRANEIMLLNPTFKNIVPKNSKIKIPTDYNYYYQLRDKK